MFFKISFQFEMYKYEMSCHISSDTLRIGVSVMEL